jgi:hypothetical protein
VKRSLLYTLLALVMTGLAVLIAIQFVGEAERRGVVAGAAIALALQIGLVWLVGHLIFPGRRMLLFGLGMGMRMVTVLAVFLVAPLFGLPLAPTLLTLVAVFLLTTLLEPVMVQPDTQAAR